MTALKHNILNVLSRNMCIRCTSIALFLCLMANGLSANADDLQTFYGVQLNNQTTKLNIDSNLWIYQDEGSSLSYNEVVSLFNQGKFDIPGSPSLNFGLTDSAVWLRVLIQNDATFERQWVLELNDARLQYFDIYWSDSHGVVKTYSAGGMTPYSQRDIKAQTHAFHLDLQANETRWVTLRIRSGFSLAASFNVWQKEEYIENTYSIGSWYALYSGICIAMLLYNLLLWITLRDAAYGYYCFSLLATASTLFAFNGVLDPLIPDGLISWLNTYFSFSFALMTLAAVLFAKKLFYHLASFSWLNTIQRAIIYGTVATVVLATTGAPGYAIALSIMIGFVGVIYVITAGIKALLMGSVIAGYFLSAWIIFLLGSLVLMLYGSGFIEHTFLVKNSVTIGSSLEMILLAMALSARMRQFKLDKEDAQQKALVMSQEYGTKLEQEVKQRTFELAQAQKELVEKKKGAAMGVFAAGMAHEMNNPLNFIKVGTENSLKQIKEFEDFIGHLIDDESDEEIQREFDNYFSNIKTAHHSIQEGAGRIELVVKSLQTALPAHQKKLSKANIAHCIDLVWKDLSAASSLDVTRNIKYGDRLIVNVSKSSLKEILEIVLTNSFDALEYFFASSSKSDIADETPAIDINAYSAEETLFVRISDNGVGMPEDIADKCFDAFFTTKPVGDGKGLGLTNARKLIRSYAGDIFFETNPNRGCCVVLTFPLQNIESGQESGG